MVSGNKAQLIKQILIQRAEGSVAITFDEHIGGDEDENLPLSTHDGTLSDSEDESNENEDGLGDGYVEHSFQVLFIDEEDIPQVRQR